MHANRLVLVLLCVAWWGLPAGQGPAGESAKREFRVATFSADVTIPLGHRCMGILPTKAQRIVDPLYAHGFVLLGADRPIALLAVDWCEIRNNSYDQWRAALAESAGTTRDRVLVCALHQHDAPVIDRGAAELLAEVGLRGELFDEPFHDDAVRRVAQALRDSLPHAQPVTHLGLGQAQVSQIASNRRVVTSDGTVNFSRGSSSGKEAYYREADEGLIDPWLKTLSFWNGERRLVELHVYATHPMSYYGRGEVTCDFVGLARDRRRRDDNSVHQIYASGCSGDVTAGKFNDGSFDSRLALTERLYQAMVSASRETRKVPLESVTFRSVPLELPFSTAEKLSERALRERLQETTASTEQRILAAMGLASRQRLAEGRPIDLPCLDFGCAQLLVFPGESFVGYQLLAQSLRPDSFVLSVGYGECWPGYIPTAAAFADGFDDHWLWVAPGSEARIRAALEKLLKTGG